MGLNKPMLALAVWVWMAAAGMLTAALWLVQAHPLASPWLACLALGLAVLSVQQSAWGWCALLTLLPVANLSIWSGWRVTDEFDVLVLLVLGGGYVQWGRTLNVNVVGSSAQRVISPGSIWLWYAWGAFMATAAVAMGRAYLDAGGGAFDMFWGDYASWSNTWRVGKSMLWILLAAPLLMYLRRDGTDAVPNLLGAGMVAGLSLACVLAVWERMVYVGLGDLSFDYRTAGWFWEMHVGGGAIDAYLALSSPFAWWALWRARTRLGWGLSALLLVMLVYVVITTYSRGLNAVFLVSSGLMWWLWRHHQAGAKAVRSWQPRANQLLLMALVIEAASLVWLGNMASDRLSQTNKDAVGRWVHWQSAYGLLQTDAAWWLGLGIGRLPSHYSQQVPGGEFPGEVALRSVRGAATHTAVNGSAQGGGVLLRGPATRADLAGEFALVQRVTLVPEGRYTVRLQARAMEPVTIRASLCERHLLYNIHCQSALHVIDRSSTEYEFSLAGDALGQGKGAAGYRQGLLGLSVMEAGKEIALQRFSLLEVNNARLSRNADFQQGLAHWQIAADRHFEPWHVDNLYLELLIERGIIGLGSFLLVLGSVGWRAYRSLEAGRLWQLPVLGSLASVSALGLIISMVEMPRMAFLLMLIMLWPSYWGGAKGPQCA